VKPKEGAAPTAFDFCGTKEGGGMLVASFDVDSDDFFAALPEFSRRLDPAPKIGVSRSGWERSIPSKAPRLNASFNLFVLFAKRVVRRRG